MPPAIPIATYRLQLTTDFTFDDAAALAPYLKELGITHLYASPFLKARPGSTHGYDIVDHSRLNPELGGEEALPAERRAEAADIGLILDFVPNHMGVGHADNAWWLDVLEWGKESPYALAFDIDWEALPFRHHPGVLLPILGRPYGDALRSGEIVLKYDGETGASRPGISITCCRSTRNAITRSSTHGRAAARRKSRPAGRCWLWPATIPGRNRRPIAPRRNSNSGFRKFRVPPRSSSAALLPIAATTMPASPACIVCWSGSTIASPIGAWLSPPSTTGAFSISTILPASGSSSRWYSAACTSGSIA